MRVHHAGTGTLTVAPKVLAFEDVDRNGRYDAHVDQRLCEATAPPLEADGEATVQCAIAAELAFAFAQAPISALVDSTNLVAERDETNNVLSSPFRNDEPPTAVTYDLSDVQHVSATEHVNTTALVAQLSDDDGNGVIDDADDVDVVYVEQLDVANQDNGGILRRIRGRDGALEATGSDPSDLLGAPGTDAFVAATSTPAIGDVDGDGVAEIVAAGWTGGLYRLFMFNSDLELIRISAPNLDGRRSDGAGPILIANLDGVGNAEIVIRTMVYSSELDLIANLLDAPHSSHDCWQPAAADVDRDGVLELILGASAFEMRGGAFKRSWKREDIPTTAYSDGGYYHVAIADLDDDPHAEIVITGKLGVRVLDHDGGDCVTWNAPSHDWIAHPGSTTGQLYSAPAIADLDGDGANELAVISNTHLTVHEATGAVDWSMPLFDPVCTILPSAFDFDGDGASELIARDGGHVYILSGAPATSWEERVLADGSFTSGTSVQAVTIADVDGDGHAELLFGCGPTGPPGDFGLAIVRNDTWAGARAAWNEDTYHVSNVGDDASIPRLEPRRWEQSRKGDYMRQISPHGLWPSGPDLTASRLAFTPDPCEGGGVLSAVIGNAGGARTGATQAWFFQGDPSDDGVPLHAEGIEVPGLPSGGSLVVELELDAASAAALADVWIVADDDGDGGGTIVETDETNNACSALLTRECDPTPEQRGTTLTLSVASEVDHHDPIEVKAQLHDASSDEVPGVFVNFTLGAGATCRALTDEDGWASCWVSTDEGVGTLSVTAESDETSRFEPASDSADVTITREECLLFLDAPLLQASLDGHLALHATLREDGALGLPSKSVGFTVGTSTPSDSTDTEGRAEASDESVGWGDHAVTATFVQDAFHVGATDAKTIHVYGPQLALSPLHQVVESQLLDGSLDPVPVTVVARLLDDGQEWGSDLPIAFRVVGSSGETATGTCVGGCTLDDDGTSTLTWTYVADDDSEVDVVRAWIDLDENGTEDGFERSVEVEVHHWTREETTLDWETTLTGDYHDPALVAVSLVDSSSAPVEGAAITIDFGGVVRRAVTSSSGIASCVFTPTQPSTSPPTVTATFSGDPELRPAEISSTFTVTLEQTRLAMVMESLTPIGGSLRARARLTEDGALPLVGEDVDFYLGTTHVGTDATDATGLAVLSIPGSGSVSARFTATDTHAAATAPAQSVAFNPAVVPDAPTIVAPVAVADGLAESRFTEAANAAAEGVTGYVVEVVATGETHALSRAEAQPPSSGIPSKRLVTDLANGTARTFKVTAANDGGLGATSSTSSAVTTYAIPAAPSVTPTSGSGEVTFSWTAGNMGGGTRDDDELMVAVGGSAAVATSPVTVSSLTPGSHRAAIARVSNTELGFGPWSALSATAVACAAPSEPVQVRAMAGPESALVVWQPPADLNGSDIVEYHVSISPTPSGTVPSPGTDVYLALDGTVGLANGTEYTITVKAENACDDETTGDSETFTPVDVPERPASLTATAKNGAIELAWPASSNDGGSAITGYFGAACTPVGVGALEGSPRLVTGLANGTACEPSIKAVNAVGVSVERGGASATPKRHPEKPLDVTAEAIHDGTIEVTWEPVAPERSGGANVTEYWLTTDPDSSLHGPFTAADAAGQTIGPLTLGRPYVVTVTAKNAVGFGAESDVSAVVVPHGLPTAPRNVIAAVAGDETIRLTWLPPADDGGLAIHSYQYAWRDLTASTSSGWLEASEHDFARRRVIVEELVAGHLYEFDVRAVNTDDETSPEETSNQVSPATLPSAVPPPEPPLDELVAGDEAVVVSWAALAPGEESGHADLLSYRICPLPADAPCVDAAPEATSVAVTGLSNGTAYRFQLRARNVVGLGASRTTSEMTPATPCGAPNAPFQVVAKPVEGTPPAIEVTWHEPTWDGGCDFDEYVVTVDGVGSTPVDADVVPLRILIDEGLTACDVYSVTVTARRGVLTGAASTAVNVTAAEPPSAPTDVVAAPGGASAVVCWNWDAVLSAASQGDGCSPVTSFEVVLESSAPPAQHPLVVGADQTCALVTGLTNGVEYSASVTATNAAGTSTAGIAATEVTPAAPSLLAEPVNPGDALPIEFVPPTVLAGQSALAIIRLASFAAAPGGTQLDRFESMTPTRATPTASTPIVAAGESAVALTVMTTAGATTSVAFEAELNGVERPGILYIEEPALLDSPCLVSLTSPADGDDVTSFGTAVTGVLDCVPGLLGPTLGEWVLELCPSDEGVPCKELGSGTADATTFGSIDPTLLLNGEYLLALTVYDVAEQPVAAASHSITITGHQKVGHYSMSFVDMTVPAAGIPIQVVRAYDSRDHRPDGDFGTGWQLSFNDVRVTRPRELSTGWDRTTMAQLGALGVTQQCFEPTFRHAVTVVFPDGTTHEFLPELSRTPGSSTPCGFDTVVHGYVNFVPVGATRAGLRPRLNPVAGQGWRDPRAVRIEPSTSTLYWENGTEDFTDEDYFEPTEWVLDMPDGHSWTLSESSGVMSVADSNFNTLTFEADGDVVSSTLGAVVDVTRDGAGRITSISDAAGNACAYQYDSLGRLWKAFDRASVAIGSVSAGGPYWTEFTYHSTLTTHVEEVHHEDTRGLTTAPPFTRVDYDSEGRVEAVCRVVASVNYCNTVVNRTLGDFEVVENMRSFPTTYHYDVRGNVEERVDARNQSWYSPHHDDDQVDYEEDPRGRVVDYTYDSDTRNLVLIEREYPSGTVLSATGIGYEHWNDFRGVAREAVTSIDTATLAPTTFTHDDAGNLRSETAPDGETTSYLPDSAGNLHVVTDPLDRVETLTWVGDVVVHEVDASGVVTTRTPDSNGNVVLTIREGSSGARHEGAVYDENDRLVLQLRPDGTSTEIVYDGCGREWKTIEHHGPGIADTIAENVYDVFGHLSRVVHSDGTAEVFEHDVVGNLVRQESRVPRGATGPPTDSDDPPVIVRHGYDELDRRYITCFGEGPALEHDEPWASGCRWRAFDDAGQVVVEVDERGYSVVHEHDDLGRIRKTCGPGGPFSSGHATFTCDDVGPDTEYQHDADGRLTVVKAEDDPGWRTFTYDAAGMLELACRKLDPLYADDDPRDSSDVSGVTCIAREHDEVDRVVAVVDASGRRTEYGYDALDHLTAVTDAADGVTIYEYDDFSNRITQVDALERVTRFGHDSMDRRISRLLPMLQSEALEHSPNRVQHVDMLGRHIEYTLDPDFGQVTSIDYDSAPGSDVTVDYYGDGQRATVVDERGTTSYARIPSGAFQGLLGSVSAPDVASLSYQYDESGNVAVVRTIRGTTTHDVFREHDGLGRLTRVADEDGREARYFWDGAGRLEQIEYYRPPVGMEPGPVLEVRCDLTYDPLTAALDVMEWRSVGGPPETLLHLDYEIDGGAEGPGRHTGVVESWGDPATDPPTRTIDYDFDALYRLVAEHHVELDGHLRDITYEYDAVGNRTRRTVAVDSVVIVDDVAVHDANDRLLASGLRTYEWNDDGTLRAQHGPAGLTTYDWDERGWLTEARPPNGDVEVEYDVDGLKQVEAGAGGTTSYSVDGLLGFGTVLEIQVDGGATTRYLRGAEMAGQVSGTTARWALTDALGSVRALAEVGAPSTLTDEWDYEAFGTQLRAEETTAETRWRFAGEEWDADLGFYYLRARQMNALEACLCSMDPLDGEPFRPSSLNKYAYVEGDPVHWVDPSGLQSLSESNTMVALHNAPNANRAFSSKRTLDWTRRILKCLGKHGISAAVDPTATSGIYLFEDASTKAPYVGRSTDFRTRLRAHAPRLSGGQPPIRIRVSGALDRAEQVAQNAVRRDRPPGVVRRGTRMPGMANKVNAISPNKWAQRGIKACAK